MPKKEAPAPEPELAVTEKDDGSVEVSTESQATVVEEEPLATAPRKPAPEPNPDPDEDGDGEAPEEIHNERDDKKLSANTLRRERQRRAREIERAERAALARKVEELTNEMARLKRASNSYTQERFDERVAQKEQLIAQIKGHLATVEDRQTHTELVERLTEEKVNLRELLAQRDKMAKDSERIAAKAPAPELDPKTSQEARRWMGRNRWFDAKAHDSDSQIVLQIDRELQAEQIWDSRTSEYWQELDRRLKEVMPERFEAQRTPPGVTASASDRTPMVRANGSSNGTFILSKERKQALIDAGVWDDPQARARHIRAYQKYDRENRET